MLTKKACNQMGNKKFFERVFCFFKKQFTNSTKKRQIPVINNPNIIQVNILENEAKYIQINNKEVTKNGLSKGETKSFLVKKTHVPQNEHIGIKNKIIATKF